MKRKKSLLLVLLLLGIGFAAVSTTLLMTGNVNISTNNEDFNVIFTKAVLDDTDVSSTAIIEDGKKITFSTKDLVKVNDVSKLDFEVINNSEMYDAEVNINCTATGDKSSYYEVTSSNIPLIKGKSTETGKVEVKLLKASVVDIHEDFTCTLTATAKERATKAVYIPRYFEFGNPTTSSTENYTTLKYTDTETTAKVFVGLDKNERQKSVCIVKNDNIECFKNNNTKFEIKHLKDVFGESNCSFDDTASNCYSSNYGCYLDSYGGVFCVDNVSSFSCSIFPDNNVNCQNSNAS